jgi:hypothetical protein
VAAKPWIEISYDLAVGALITMFFYLLVVRLPDYQRRRRLSKDTTRLSGKTASRS